MRRPPRSGRRARRRRHAAAAAGSAAAEAGRRAGREAGRRAKAEPSSRAEAEAGADGRPGRTARRALGRGPAEAFVSLYEWVAQQEKATHLVPPSLRVPPGVVVPASPSPAAAAAVRPVVVVSATTVTAAAAPAGPASPSSCSTSLIALVEPSSSTVVARVSVWVAVGVDGSQRGCDYSPSERAAHPKPDMASVEMVEESGGAARSLALSPPRPHLEAPIGSLGCTLRGSSRTPAKPIARSQLRRGLSARASLLRLPLVLVEDRRAARALVLRADAYSASALGLVLEHTELCPLSSSKPVSSSSRLSRRRRPRCTPSSLLAG